jgi:hypothetical protein
VRGGLVAWVGCTDGDWGGDDWGRAGDGELRAGDCTGLAPWCFEADDDECELMRTATLANAMVSTMSRAKRIAWTRMSAPCTDKLHHNRAATTKTIGLATRTCRDPPQPPVEV